MDAHTKLGHPPFFHVDGRPASHLENAYSSQAAALICGGPSFLGVDHGMIRGSGMVTMTLNNGFHTFRSDLWLGVDSPRKFTRSLWKDEHITKFVHSGKTRYRRVRQGSRTFTYQRSDAWCSEQLFAPENPAETFGLAPSHGYRTSMIEAIRVLFALGIRTIYLFGVDFFQSPDHGYHHPAPGFRARIDGNNRLYGSMSRRLALMRPLMEAAGLSVYNCNPASHLTVFEKRSFPYDSMMGATHTLERSRPVPPTA